MKFFCFNFIISVKERKLSDDKNEGIQAIYIIMIVFTSVNKAFTWQLCLVETGYKFLFFHQFPPKKLFNALRCHLYGSEGLLKQCLNRDCKIIGFKCVCLYVNFAYFAYFSSNFIFFACFSIYRGKYLLFYTSKNFEFSWKLILFFLSFKDT